MGWQQLKFRVRPASSPEAIDRLEDELLQRGSLSISYLDAEDQPVFQTEPGATILWDNCHLISLFEESTSLQPVCAWLKQQPEIIAASLVQENLADQDWERSWMDSFNAMQYGPRLWICPSWQKPPDPSAVNIMLDPGLAFGSGTHATTSLCLQWLEQHIDPNSEDIMVVDYGCGSGVLAIGAVLLGAKEVHAVDNDPQAITATRDNMSRNHLRENDIQCWLPEEFPNLQADVLVANILAEPLKQLAPLFAKSVKPGGALVLSGLLTEQADEISAAYTKWFAMDAPAHQQEWVRLNGVRNATP